MVSSQPQRSGTILAWWARTGSTNRGFVSLDPERQCEADCARPAPRRATNAFAFEVRGAAVKARPGRDERKGGGQGGAPR